MVAFDKEALESYKYTDLVKLAKEHDVYRRYAPKIELVDKLMALSEPTAVTLDDVSMPSFMEDDTESDEAGQDVENTLPDKDHNSPKKENNARVKSCKVSSLSPRAPLMDKRKNTKSKVTASKSEAPFVFKNKSDTPRALRRSLAGPAKPVMNGHKLKRETTFDIEDKADKQLSTPQSATRRLTRQRTFDVEAKNSTSHQIKPFDIESTNKEAQHSHSKKKDTKCVVVVQKLRREGTFEVEDNKTNTEKVSCYSLTRKMRREGTFEVENTSTSNSQVPDAQHSASLTVATFKEKATPKYFLHEKQPARMSQRSSYSSRKVSIATPSSMKPMEIDFNTQSVPRQYITSRTQPLRQTSPGAKSSATKSKIPSLAKEIQKKKAEVSAKKFADATGEKPMLAKKAPDFSAIHKRLFGKMESLVDSRQKVIDKANSIQKTQLQYGKKSPGKTKVVRKLLSPKAGKLKLASPKPTLQHVASAYASSIQTIQKRPSVGSLTPGVSKLQSPRFVFNVNNKGTTGTKTQFGFTKNEPSRREAMKASVLGRKPTQRSSPMSKAKQALQTVRLNKRFELQMKHRLAQQGA